jgi:methylmalonyl-CoA/ethylmalonyl-CoA epimerase
MEPTAAKASFGSHFSQVAWVVKDIQVAEKFFQDVMGIGNFVRLENLRAQDLEGTYYGQPGNFEFHLYMAYSGESLIELIQPLGGRSIFQDYLEKNPAGGIQHIAYSIPVSDLDIAISELTNKGYPVITSLNLPVAKVVFFDTYKEIGVVTEVIGLTEAGVEFVQHLRSKAI